jgi:hypothetical protein
MIAMTEHFLPITGDSTLKDLKAAFHSWFPHLKLEFFKRSHSHAEGSPAKELLPDGLHVSQATSKGLGKELLVSKGMSVEALEDAFESTFGLHVQVFRRSGKIWLETSVTDKWTLERQNAHGAESDLPRE